MNELSYCETLAVSPNATLKGFISEWKLWLLIIVGALFMIDVACHLFNFPLRLVLLRIGLYFAEGTWLRFRP